MDTARRLVGKAVSRKNHERRKRERKNIFKNNTVKITHKKMIACVVHTNSIYIHFFFLFKFFHHLPPPPQKKLKEFSDHHFRLFNFSTH